VPTKEELDTCFQAVWTKCSDRGLEAIRLDEVWANYIGVQLQGETRKWDLYVKCDETELKLPGLYLRGANGLLAHVSYSGTVCVNDGQGLSIDPDRHTDIIAYTVLAGFDLLEKSAVDAATDLSEFLNELEGYWLGLPSSLRGRAAFEVDGKDRLITAYAKNTVSPPKWYFTDRETPAPSEFRLEKLAALRALYVHLDELPTPPSAPDKLGPNFIEAVRARFTPVQLELWSKLLGPSKNSPKRIALMISVPRPAGGRSLVGAVFGARGGVIDHKVEVFPLTVRRHTPMYMRERGGASLELLGKHIVVIGCGAVGSVAADSLAASGVGKLTLVDHDIYSEDNVFRHVLDPMWIDMPKVLGLQFEFHRKYPGIRVTEVATTAQEWLKVANLESVDGVVIALGMPSLERSFSRALRGSKKPLPILFTWLEALDLGGHSVLSWSDNEGCVDCLYRDDEGHPALHPRTSFLEPDQQVSRNLTGCASVFIPFGALQARRTGLMAAEHMLLALNGEAKSSYRYWVGEGSAAAGQGLRTTSWWKEARDTPHDAATLRVFGQPCKRCRRPS